MDAHAETDRLLAELEKEIEAYYAKVGKKLDAIQAQALRTYYRQLADKKDQLKNGEITSDEFKDWCHREASSATVKSVAKKLTDETVKADSAVVEIINAAMVGIYVLNRLESEKQTHKQAEDIKRKNNVSITVRRIATREEIIAEYKRRAQTRNQDKLLFQAALNHAKDTKWTQKHFEAAIYHGVRAGYTENRMERTIRDMMGENCRSCIRYARTYTTANEGLACYENGMQMDADGWEVTKEWQSLHDRRVRDSHKKQNNETIDIKERFTNGLLYPGDRSTNDPGEFINCRCRIQIKAVGVKDGS